LAEEQMTNKKIIIEHFNKADQKIAPILAEMEFEAWIEVVPKELYFQKLCREIISQQLAGKAADAIYNRFLKQMPKGTVTPNHILDIDNQTLRDCGLSWAKVKYIKNLAQQTQDRTVNLDKLGNIDDETVVTELTKVKGIGRWTAEMFLIFSLGREDVFSFGDLGLRKGLKKIYDLNRPTQKQILKIVKRWTPYKTFGSLALWQSLENTDD
jgi:DNA-3-methyladenine glycosylase II